MTHVLDDLEWRGLIAQTTDLDALRAGCRAGRSRTTADSTRPRRACTSEPGADPHLRRLQRAGHRPLALVGGATGLIGDPKVTGERTLNSEEVVAGWVERIRGAGRALSRLRRPTNAATHGQQPRLDRALSAIDFLRDVGKHFRLSTMLAKETVSARLNSDDGHQLHRVQLPDPAGHGLPRAVPPLRLHPADRRQRPVGQPDRRHRLIRRVEGHAVHALATPLITKADGTKFGKTEGGAVWLDPR